jgi:hypothetical protein
MKYVVVYKKKLETGDIHQKWIPSTEFKFTTEYLLERMESDPDVAEYLGVPFVFTLCAGLEAMLNDWLNEAWT